LSDVYINKMFKEIQAGLSKFMGKRWIPIVLVLIVCFALITYSTSKNNILDRMSDGSTGMNSGSSVMENKPSGNMSPPPMSPQAQPEHARQPSASSGDGYDMQPVANPSDLLPKDINSQWSALNPVNQNNVAMPDLLQAGYHIGLDTIGQTMKNPNLQIRSDPIIQKRDVGPWNNSTTEADYARVPLELGYGGR
jgi:hypothetical protein